MPQQRRAQATRHAIIVAAAEEFVRRGYAGTPLSAILRRGRVTKGAFYFHFTSKEAVASIIVRMRYRRLSQLWRRWMRRELDPLSTAIGIIDEATTMVEQDVVLRAGMILASQRLFEQHEPPLKSVDWEALLVKLLRRSADNGQLRSGVDPSATARVIYTALIGVGTLGSGGRGGMSMVDRVAELWRVMLRDIASTDWLQKHHRLPAPD